MMSSFFAAAVRTKVRRTVSVVTACLAVVPLAMGTSGCSLTGSEPVTAPVAYKTYGPPDNSFACLAPDDPKWKNMRAGQNGMLSSVLFSRGDAKIDIEADLKGSLQGDIVNASNAQMGNFESLVPANMQGAMPKKIPVVEQMHLTEGKKLLEKRGETYKEGSMKPFVSAVGEARVSEWTHEGRHGYRMTIMGGDRRFRVSCVCAEKDWNTLKPEFQKVVGSLKPGTG